jgi:ribosomal silencing factor RsfS
MQVAGLVVVEGVGSARRRSIIARRLVSEAREGETVGVEEGGREAPWFVVAAWSWVRIFDIFMVTEISNERRMLAMLRT